MEDADDAEVDPRVKGAIEGLNSAIDRVNMLEDEKNTVTLQASRAASVEDSLDEEYSDVEKRLAPLHKANAAAVAASEGAEQAEQRYGRALGEVEMAREALAVMHSDTRHCVPSRDPGVRQMERHLQEKLSSCARRAASGRQQAQRARAAADKAARHVAAVVQSLERKGALEEVIDLELTYREQREGLHQVQTLRDDRLGEIDASKEEAVSLVQEAMQRLETLSNELHEHSGDSPAQGAGEEGAAAGDDNGAAEPPK